MLKTAKSKINNLIAEESDHIYSEHTQADVQAQIGNILVDILQLGSNANAVSSGIETASASLPGTIMIELFSRRAARDVVSKILATTLAIECVYER